MAPRDRNDPERQRRIEQQRAAAQEGAAGRRPGDPFGTRGSPDNPFHVRISGAYQGFYDQLRGGGGQTRAGAPEGRDAPGFSAMIADQRAVHQQAVQITGQLRVAADMMVNFTTDLGRFADTQRTIQRAERERIDEVLDRIERSFRSGGSGGDVPRETSGSRRAPRGDNRPAGPSEPIAGSSYRDLDDDQVYPMDDSSGLAPPAANIPAGPKTKSAKYKPPAHTQFGTHLRQSQPTSLSGMRRNIERRAGQALHDRYGLGTARKPTLAPVHDEETGALSHYQLHGPAGVVEDNIAPDDDRIPGLIKSAGRQAAVSAGASGLAKAGFMGASKAVPVVGQVLMAAELINKGFEFATEQRKENQAWQSIYGGENVAGFGQRAQEQGFVWGQRFTNGLTEDDSRKLFQGVSQTGLKDGQRAGLLDFATEQYKQHGVSIEQSMKLIDISVRNANSGLAGLSQSLGGVTKAAVRTGQSAEFMRDKFIENYAAAAAAGFGTSASTIAGGLTLAGQGQNRAFAGLNQTGLMSETAMRINASQQGKSYGQLVGDVMGGNTAGATKGMDRIVNQTVSSMISGEAKRFLQQQVASHGGADAVNKSPGAQRDIAQKMLQAGYLDPGVVSQVMGPMGVDMSQMNPEQVAEWVVNQQTNPNAITAGTEKQKGEQGQQQIKAGDVRAEQRGFGSFLPGGGATVVGSQFVRDNWSTNPFNTSGQEKNAALGNYGKYQQATGHQDPAIEALISKVGGQSEVGVKVQTKDGEKVVSLAEAIQSYPDQVAKGTAYLEGGTETGGRQIKEVVGFGETNYQGEDTTQKEGGPGVTSDEWKQLHPTDATEAGAEGSGGTVTISPTPELARLFNFQTTGNVKTEGAASAGVPPVVGGAPPR